MKVLILLFITYSSFSYSNEESQNFESIDHATLRNLENLYGSKTKQIWPGVENDLVSSKTKQIWPGVISLKNEIRKMKVKTNDEKALFLAAVLDELGLSINDLSLIKK